MERADDPSPDAIITARNVDLSSCDRELIQFPDAIQPHGVLLTVDETSGRILHASANCAWLLGVGPAAVLGRSADAVLGRHGHELLEKLHHMALDGGPVHVAHESFVGARGGFNLFAHRCGGLILLELESAVAVPDASARNLYADLRADITRLQATRTLAAFLDLAVQRIRSFTGFDRVMAYRFDEDGSGHVVAESRRDDLEAYLGLHYPASDIPAPARRMFALSWARHLPDVDYEPVPLVALDSPLVSGPVDMSFAGLRSVSVMYSGYLRNMGVRATMVMPLMKEGRLWGLVSAMHHQAPRHLPHEVRMAAESLAHTLSLLMSAKEDSERFERLLAMQATTDRLVRAAGDQPDLAMALSSPGSLADVLAQVDAAGAAVVTSAAAPGAGVVCVGSTPSSDQVRALAGWVGTRAEPLFATDRLPAQYAPAQEFADVGSGLLAVRLSPSRPEMLLWFRPEQVAQVNWAGNPDKPVDVDLADGTQRLRPRGSFALWMQSVHKRSTPWLDSEKDAVLKLRRTIDERVVQPAQALQAMGHALTASQVALDGFAHAATHDLKQQLRGLHHLATGLQRRQGDALDDEGRQQIATIVRLTQRMDALIDALLAHSRIGTDPLALEEVDLDTLVDAALQAHADRIAAQAVEVRRPAPLGRVRCDRARLSEVFSHLVANALQYNDKAARWIEFGAEPGPPLCCFVRDNGVGIAPADQELVFQLFHRLHPGGGDDGGAGIGLSTARKIVQRHGGRMWVQSVPGEGSTFCFTLGPGPVGQAPAR